MSFSVFINFDKNCREAVTFYANVFDQEIPKFLTYGEGDTSFDSNVAMSEEGKDFIMHTSLNILGTTVEFSDMPDNFEFIRGNTLMLTLICKSVEEAMLIFQRLSENGRPFVPLSLMEGQGYYGMVADQFNLSWIVKTIETK